MSESGKGTRSSSHTNKLTKEQVFGQQVKALFNQCADISVQQQLDFINDSPFSETVKSRTKDLLKHHQEDSNLTQDIVGVVKNSLGVSSLQTGDLVEQYRLLHPIGEGGQGEVWLAARNDGEFKHLVAIKFIKLTHNQRELLRFQTERELLASLHHANIAQLIGGGRIEERLYMIMEWVDGVSITAYANQNKLKLFELLKCFIQVCDAVRFAHSNGIIHRDIKPSNILVKKDGTVKLLDFGIAKTLDADDTVTKSATMLTLSYSSPEQINGRPASTASDIYALGVVLYELLTKQKVYKSAESVADLIRDISDVSPVIPSLAKPVGTERFASKRLQGDLDNLVMMAIRKEPSRRYLTVQDLIGDVQNYLQSKPLIASGDSIIYKGGKLFKRNPIASLFAVLLLGFMIGLPIVLYTSGQQIAYQRDQAQQQASLADETSKFLVTLFESSSPLASKGESIDLQDVLLLGERQLQSEFLNQPKLKANLLSTFGSIQYHLKNTQKAIGHYQQAVEIFTQSGDKIGLLGALDQLAIMRYRNGEIDKATAVMNRADSVSESIKDVTALAWHNAKKANLLDDKGEYDIAKLLMQNTLENLKRNNINDINLLGVLYNQLSLSFEGSDDVLSLKYNETALEYAKKAVGTLHPHYLNKLFNQAVILINLHRYDEAQEILQTVRKGEEKLYTKGHPRYANALGEQATLWHDLGQFKMAESAYLESINIYQTQKSNTNYARSINNLAYLYEDMGELNKAEPLYRESIKLRIQQDSSNLIRIASAQGNLARLLARSGRYPQARDLIQRVIKTYSNYKRGNLYNQIILIASNIGDGKNAQQCKQGINAIKAIMGELQKKSIKSWRRMQAELWIGKMAVTCGDNDLARENLNAALEKSKNIYKKDSLGQQIIANQVGLNKSNLSRGILNTRDSLIPKP